MPSSIGLSYAPGIWRWFSRMGINVRSSLLSDHPVLVLDATLDLACVETQISTGIPEPDERDCELLEWSEQPLGKLAVPARSMRQKL